jgi:ADP-heptose:LPS heptosyltransferase
LKFGLFGSHLLGDALMQTPAIRALRAQWPDATIEYYHGSDKPGMAMLEGNPCLDRLEQLAVWPRHRGDYPFPRFTTADVIRGLVAVQAFMWGIERGKSLAEGFGHALGVEVTDLRYDYAMTEAERARGRVLVDEYGDGRPVVVVARHSVSCESNNPAVGRANKCVPNQHWHEVSVWLEKQGYRALAVGSTSDAVDPRFAAWEGARAYGLPIRDVAGILAASHAVLSVDTGVRHLAAAVGANLYCISGCVPLSLIRCVPVRPGQRIHEEVVPVHEVRTGTLLAGASKVL